MKYTGCAYYPEYWGTERVKIDAALMKEAGINIVRVGEFAWSMFEPKEGEYSFGWMHDAIDILGEHGISVMLCTPTAAPPAWLTSKHPKMLLVREDGKKMMHGFRRHYCHTSDLYKEYCLKITDRLSRDMDVHKNVVAWQIDNELGPEDGCWCACDNCNEKFQAMLIQKYRSLEELNRNWKTAFWSIEYSDWSQIRLAHTDVKAFPTLRKESRRFYSDSMIEFALLQAKVLKQNHPGAVVSTNGMSPIYPAIDYYQLFSSLDVPMADLYFDGGTLDTSALSMNCYRNYSGRNKYWVAETGAGALDYGRPPKDGQFRAWMWSNFAHGAEAYMVFRWRTCLSGQEQELQGILEYSGYPGHRYRQVKEAYLEINKVAAQLGDLPLTDVDVGIVYDFDVMLAYGFMCIKKDFDYEKYFMRLHKAFYNKNLVCDIVSPLHDLGRYKLLILPSIMIINEAFARKLREYVNAGGVVLAVGQTGIRDFYNNYIDFRGPEHLQDLLGIHINGGMFLFSHVAPDESMWAPIAYRRNFTVKMSGTLEGRSLEGVSDTWITDVELNDARVLMSFSEDTYKGQPALVEKTTGKGMCVYMAPACVDDGLMSEIIEYCADKAGLKLPVQTPEYVEIVRRGKFVFIINHLDQAVEVDMGKSFERVVLGIMEQSLVKLPPFGVCIAADSTTAKTSL